MSNPITPPRLLRKPEVLRRTGMASSTLYAAMAKGTFPLPLKIGARSVAWTEESIVDWINNRPVADLRREEAAE